MVQYIPPPDPRTLLPHLLACLPTAFVSPRAPPALLPLLSPILRQRIDILASTSRSPSESWLPLLCWDPEMAKQLVEIVCESDAFEPHPTSGEIETGTIEPIVYRRLDEETLQAKVTAPETQLEVIVLWCGTDGKEEDAAWRIAEVLPFDANGSRTSEGWYPSIAEAEEKARDKAFQEAIGEGDDGPASSAAAVSTSATDEDDYWAQYDKTPGRTPGARQSPAHSQALSHNRHARTTSEAEYFERYAGIQPEMDNDDPSQDAQAIGESTLDGNVLASSHDGNETTVPYRQMPDRSPSQLTASASNTRSAAVDTLEQAAETHTVFVTSVRQHVSTSVKSLFRLCRATGMEMAEFEQMVQTEVQALSLLEEAE